MTTVLITGCSSGFGLEAALAFARRGDTVIATMRNLEKSASLEKQAADEGLTIHLQQLDVMDGGSIEAACSAVAEAHGGIDVLVNNAGVGYAGPIETIDESRARALFETNFWGPMMVSRQVLPSMRAKRSGVIINVTSLAGRLPGLMYSGMYGASKHALGALSEALASEVDPYGIRVVCIEPGFFATEITNNGAYDEGDDPVYETDQRWFRSFMEGGVAGGAHPSIVADAIVAAATDETTPLHVLVGEDTTMYMAVLDSVDGFESWVDAVMPVVEQAAGPRPTID